MTRKRKRAPATAPTLDQQLNLDVKEHTPVGPAKQSRKSGFAQALASPRHLILARLTEKQSCVGNQYFVGQLGDAHVVMLRSDQVAGAEPEWAIFLAKRRRNLVTEAVTNGDADNGGAS